MERTRQSSVLIAQAERARKISVGKPSVEETVKFVFADNRSQAVPQLCIVSGTPLTAGCRTIEDAHELALMKLASAVSRKAAYKSLKAGMTQHDLRTW